MINEILAFFNRKLIDKNFCITLSVRITLKGFLSLLLIAYCCLELYFYCKVGPAFIKWHTHLMLYAYLGIAGVYLAETCCTRSRSENVQNLFLLYNSVIFVLFLLEGVFIFMGFGKTVFEEENGYYQDPAAYNKKNYYNIYPPGKPHWLTTSEWSYLLPTNSLGYADNEWSVEKRAGEKRILVLGDSFTEGDGAPYDSNYVSLLRHEFKASADPVYIMNAGTCSSDPFYNYLNLKDRLLKFKPDIVIQSFRTIDLDQYFTERGGLERFQQDGTVKYRSAPFWEPLYAISYISRPFFSVTAKAVRRLKAMAHPDAKNINFQSYYNLFSKYAALCREHHIQLVIILHPGIEEVESNKYNCDIRAVVNPFSSAGQIKVIDLLPAFRSYIKKQQSQAAAYYWKNNTHHNSNGYQMMAKTVFEGLAPILKNSISGANKP